MISVLSWPTPECPPYPVIGGFLAERRPWQWTQWVVLMFCAATFLGLFLQCETYKKPILLRRARARARARLAHAAVALPAPEPSPGPRSPCQGR